MARGDIIVIDPERFERLTVLRHGSHAENDKEMCVMEAVAWVTHQEWSDSPPCVCPVLGAFMRVWNDGLPNDAERTRLLKPLIPDLIKTKGSEALEARRATMATEWLVRVHAPAWLGLAKLDKQARDAAWDAAWAAALSKTTNELQQSALVLAHRMIALKDDTSS